MHEPLDPPTGDRDATDPDGPCFCVCKGTSTGAENEDVPGDQAGVYAAVFYDIGGEPDASDAPPAPPAST